MLLIVTLLRIEEIKSLVKDLIMMFISKMSYGYLNASYKVSKMFIDLKEGKLQNENLIVEQIIEIYSKLDPKAFGELVNGTFEIVIKWFNKLDVEVFLSKIAELPKESIEQYFDLMKTMIKFKTDYSLEIAAITEKFETISPELKEKLKNLGEFLEDKMENFEDEMNEKFDETSNLNMEELIKLAYKIRLDESNKANKIRENIRKRKLELIRESKEIKTVTDKDLEKHFPLKKNKSK